MKFRKMSVLFALKPGISGIFGRMESAPEIHFTGARGTADRNAASKEDEAHASDERFDHEYGLQKMAQNVNSRHS